MIRIGLIDHYLDEWHANHYPDMIRAEAARQGIPMEIACAYADCDKEGGLTTRAWCDGQGCEQASSLEEIARACDAFLLLAPSFPELHEEMARIPLSLGKPVFVDKIFAPDRRMGGRIFAHAASHGAPIFSSSALRFCDALALYREGKGLTARWCLTSGPNSFAVYAIHQIEMLQTVMGGAPKRVKAFGNSGGRTAIFDYGDGRMGQMAQMDATPFALSVSDGQRCAHSAIGDEFFANLVGAIVRFFVDGLPPVSNEDTLCALDMLEASRRALESPDTWISLTK